MTSADYEKLREDIIEMSMDIEGIIDMEINDDGRPKVDKKGNIIYKYPNEDDYRKLIVLWDIVNIINDIPKSTIDFATNTLGIDLEEEATQEFYTD